jgi:hypothetical protein
MMYVDILTNFVDALLNVLLTFLNVSLMFLIITSMFLCLPSIIVKNSQTSNDISLSHSKCLLNFNTDFGLFSFKFSKQK